MTLILAFKIVHDIL